MGGERSSYIWQVRILFPLKTLKKKKGWGNDFANHYRFAKSATNFLANYSSLLEDPKDKKQTNKQNPIFSFAWVIIPIVSYQRLKNYNLDNSVDVS